MAEKIDKEAELKKLKETLEDIKKDIETKQTDEEIPVVERIANFEMFNESNKLDAIYNEVLNLKANLNYLREKVLEIQTSVGKPS